MNKLYTIIYYTSNRETEEFENKVKSKLLGVSGDIPIISVSQKPITLGKNICVGDVGASDHNLFRQILTGCKEATTPFVISCEADCLYPPDYFNFTPTSLENCYRFNNLYILNQWGTGDWGGFWPKSTAPFAQIAKRDWYISEIEKAMTGRPYWSKDGDRTRIKIFMDIKSGWTNAKIKNPILSLKTGNGMRVHTKPTGFPVAEIPYWGKAEDLRRELWPVQTGS